MSFLQTLKVLFQSLFTPRKKKDELIAAQLHRIQEEQRKQEQNQLEKQRPKRKMPPLDQDDNPPIQPINKIINTSNEKDLKTLTQEIEKLEICCQKEDENSQKLATQIKNFKNHQQCSNAPDLQFYEFLSPLQKQFYLKIYEDEYKWFIDILKMRGNQLQVIISHPHIKEILNYKNLQTLKPGAWLNDEICNAYIALLNDYNQNMGFSTVIVNTFFYGLYSDTNATKLLRLSAKQKITSQTKLILVPFNEKNTHWSLFVINRDTKIIAYYDSLTTTSDQIRAYSKLNQIAQIWDKNLNEEFEQEYKYQQGDSPQQQNFCDCGVFMLKNIQILSQNRAIKLSKVYNQDLIFYDRIQIGVVLKRGKYDL